MSCLLCGSEVNLKRSIKNGYLYCEMCLEWHYNYNPNKEWYEIVNKIRYLPKHPKFK